METLPQIIGMITQILSILGVAFLVYKHFASADQKFDKTIGMNGTACEYKHRIIDEKFVVLMEAVKTNAADLKQIKDNHLFHIEKDIASINTAIAIILDREERGDAKKKI
jgi:hypothetical protein